MFPLIDEAIVGAVELQRREQGGSQADCLGWQPVCSWWAQRQRHAKSRRIQSAMEAD